MSLQLSLWEPPSTEDAPPVWSTLNDEVRAEVVAILARLVGKAATGHLPGDQEQEIAND